ncbi:MAG: energy transducer TonB [Edaphobacter sp.]|uniref:energy transducer TonB n=1 Tax=Edaphobacter sp. TaxID=1934404 RepID=UPI0023A34F47|nr:energy transducer TonB [Edaphobacter sp.]MDE1176746.1 energy transducer TonB [Edaphobacter sp.]
MTDEQKLEEHGQAVKRLRSLFDMHHLPFGAPEHLGGLLVSLHESRHFAMDFWSLVNTLSDSGSGSLNEDQMLHAVVEASAGTGPDALPEHERPGVHELRQMLAGVDIARPVELPAPIAEPVDSLLPRRTPAAGKFSAALETGGHHDPGGYGDPGIYSAPDSRNDPGRHDHPDHHDEMLRKRRSIGDALSRLEQSTGELRRQLAALDVQMSETAPATATGLGSALAEIHPPAAVQAAAEEATVARWNRTDAPAAPRPEAAADEETAASPRAEAIPPKPAATPRPEPVIAAAAAPIVSPTAPPTVLPTAHLPTAQPTAQPVVVPPAAAPSPTATVAPIVAAAPPVEVFARRATTTQRGLALSDPDDDPSIRAPFSDYARETEGPSPTRRAIPLVIVALLIAAGFAVWYSQAGHRWLERVAWSIHHTYDSAMERKDDWPKPGAATPAPDAGSAPQNPDQNPAQSPDQSTAQSTAQSTPPSTPITPPQQPQATTPAASAPAPSATAPAPAPQTPPQSAADTQRRNPETSDPTLRGKISQAPIDAGVLRVPGSTMVAYLLTSRVPAYPESARALEIEGHVTMEIVVSETGAVRFVHVIDGDRHLRLAAEEAVLRYRYKPYLLNGEAVEVTTTVTVDFRLPD